MKNKLLNLFILIGLCGFATACFLVATNITQFGALWLDYVFLGSLLIVFVCLNFKFRKYTPYDETVSCLRRAKKSVASVKTGKEINYVKLLAVQNQLSNASIYLSDLTSSLDLYELKDAVSELEIIRSHYKTDENFRLTMDEQTHSSDVAALGRIIDSVKSVGQSKE